MKRLFIYILVFASLYFIYFKILRGDKQNQAKLSILYEDLMKITGTLYSGFERTSLGEKFSDYKRTDDLISDVLNNYDKFDEYQIKQKKEELLREKENLKLASYLRRLAQSKFMDISINLLDNELEKRNRIKIKDYSPYKEVMEKDELEKKNLLKARKEVMKEIGE